MKNNRLREGCGSDKCGNDGCGVYDNEMKEALKRSIEDENLYNERKKEKEEYERVGQELIENSYENEPNSKVLRKEIKVENEVIDIDDSSNEDLKERKDFHKDLVGNMFHRVNKRMKAQYTAGMKDVRRIDDKKEKDERKEGLMRLKKSLRKLKEDESKGDHIDLIERLTADDNDLLSPDKVNSQNVMELIIDEHEMDDE